MKSALVIGGTGFLGLNLVDTLLEDGWQVRVPVRRHSITLFLQSRRVERVRVDAEDPATLRAAMEGQDVVFMVAGHYPRYSAEREREIRIGTDQIRGVCEAARDVGVGRLVYTSSTGALAPAPAGRIADERDVPAELPVDSTYRAVKWAMERELERSIDAGLDAVTMIPSGCIGPWDARVGTGRLVLGVVRRELPYWVEGTVALVDVGDVARAQVRAATAAPSGSRYCLNGASLPISELLGIVAQRYGGEVPPRLELEEARARADAEERVAAQDRARVGVPRELVDLAAHGQPVSSARAMRDLDFAPRDLVDSLDRAHAWYAKYGYVRKTGGKKRCSEPPSNVAPAPSS